MKDKKEVEQLADEFESCQKILTALGDEARHHLILQMMLHGKDSLKWVQSESRKSNCVGIYAAHDPEVNPGKYEF